MTAKTSFMLSVLLLGSPVGRVAGDQAAPVSAAESFNDAGAMDGWSFSNGPEWPGARGALERRPGGGRTNDGVLVLRYDFEQGGHYVAARVQLPGERKIDAVRLWINKPSSNVMIFRGEDSQGESFQKNLRFDYRGWQQLEIALGGWEFHWGGDGVFQGPPRQFDILIENDGGNRSGELLIDDVQWVYQPPSQPAPEQRTPAQGPDGTTHSATYLESDFGPADNWSYAGSTAGGFESNHWTYDFAAGSDRCALNRGRSILGRPTALRLTVISDGSGNELTALFGSHFQLFDRSLGILDTLGPKTFEVPMGDMSTWHHFGGEDDGLVRYPLRLENLGLAKKTDQTSGVLRLIRLEFVTEFDRRQTVAVVPSVASREGDGLRFTVVLRSLHDAPLQGKLHYSLRSLDRSAETGSVDLVVPPGGPSVTHQFETSYGDHTMIEGRFQFVAGRVSSRKVSTTIARRTAGPIDTTLVPDSRIGVGMYLYRFHGHPQADRWMQRMCELAAAAGVKWTREEFHWNWVEPIKGQRDFTFFDRLVETANANGISVYGLVCYWTDWSKPPFTDQFIEDYCDYLRALVGRYRGTSSTGRSGTSPTYSSGPAPRRCTPSCWPGPTRRSRRLTRPPRCWAVRRPASIPRSSRWC
ncbi:MAG: hypothetical protein GY778_04100 [bacterium]|nr:hypothetical protein [bacterium]